MTELPTLERIVFYCSWCGFARPPFDSAKLVIERSTEGYLRHSLPEDCRDVVPREAVENLLLTLQSAPVAALDLARFPHPPQVMEEHYRGDWTDDYPSLAVHIEREGGRLELRTEAQQDYMLPFAVTDTASGAEWSTYDPALSVALAELMPEGFLHKERLAGQCWLRDPESVQDDSPPPRQASPDGQTDEYGQTALMKAAYPPFKAARFEELVRAGGIDVDARRYDGLTGLHLACSGWMVPAAEAWLAAGADVHARTPEEATPLMLGAVCPGVVRALLAAGAEVNAVDQDGHSALVYLILRQAQAMAPGMLVALEMLLEAGADRNLADAEGKTPLEHARFMLRSAQVGQEVSSVLRRELSDELREHRENLRRTLVNEPELRESLDWDDLRRATAVLDLLEPVESP